MVPKVKEANNIKQYRPICLLNVDYKGVTKVLNNRLVTVAKEVIGDNQTRFVNGKNILEGLVILHKVLHELRSKGKRGLILKINFEKAYDMVTWDFLEEVMRGKGFLDKWIDWVMRTVQGAKGAPTLELSGDLDRVTRCRLCSFNLVANTLSALLDKAVARHHITRVLSDLIRGGGSHPVCGRHCHHGRWLHPVDCEPKTALVLF